MRSLFIIVFLLPLSLAAQETTVDSAYMASIEQLIDSLQRRQNLDAWVRQYEVRMLRDEMHPGRDMYVPLLRGLFLTATNHSFNDRTPAIASSGSNAADYVPALTPLAATYSLHALGIQGRSTTRRLLTATAFALALETALTEGLKHTVSELRPDHSDDQSLPSGHTATAYLSATILHREYGHLSPWISVAGYSTATLTEYLRLRHHRHYVNDILIGSGIGVATANFGYFLADQIHGIAAINPPRFTYGDLQRYQQFHTSAHTFSLLTGTEFGGRTIPGERLDILNDEFNGNIRLKTSTTYSAGIEYSYPLTPHWGADISLRLSTALVKPDVSGTDNALATNLQGSHLQQWHIDVAAHYATPLRPDVKASFRILAGYRYTQQLTLTSDNTDNQPIVRLPAEHTPEIGCGIGCDLLDSRKFIVGFTFDYLHAFTHLLPNRYTVNTYWRICL